MDDPSRRPARPAARTAPAPTPRPDHDPIFLPPDPVICNGLTRPIWNPYHGHGHLIGLIGTPPVFAHVADYPDRPDGYRLTPQHCGAFFVLN